MKRKSMKPFSHHPGLSPRRSHRRAFTLIEMITVISIIVLVLAAALPVWNVLTGNRSLEAGYNQVSAMIGTARSDAIYNRTQVGVVFFVDPTNGQVTMDEVTATGPALNFSSASNTVKTANASDNSIDFFGRDFNRETVPLPTGVGLALYNNQPNISGTLGSPDLAYDRYFRFGVIMFDPTGTVEPFPYGVSANSQLGARLLLSSTTGDLGSSGLSTNPDPPTPLTSSVGILLYDRVTFAAQVAAGITPDADLDYVLPLQSQPTLVLQSQPSETQKETEETWLDNNGLSALVSPANGSLIKAK
jgi:prepilin-type N-terminal cleavage/methylation domain-containing protein